MNIRPEGASRYVGKEICYQTCPVCGDNDWNFYIDPQTGAWFCFDGDHYRGGVSEPDLPEDEEGNLGRSLLFLLEPPKSKPSFDDIAIPAFKTLGGQACDYLRSRGVDPSYVTKMGWVEETEEPRIIIPFWERGLLTYWTSRLYTQARGPKYKYPIGIGRRLFYLPKLDPPNSVLVLTEGVFDALAVHKVGYAAVALGGKTIPHDCHLQLREIIAQGSFQAVAVMLDYDALPEIIDLVSYGSVWWPHTFPVVCTAKDPAAMTQAEIYQAMTAGLNGGRQADKPDNRGS